MTFRTATRLEGTLAERPPAGVSRRFYLATDEGKLYYDDGAAWSEVGASGPSLPDIPNLWTWLNAESLGLSDGATVTAWADDSGQGNDVLAINGQPIYEAAVINGLPVVSLAGGQWFSLPIIGNSGASVFTMFILASRDTTARYSLAGCRAGSTGWVWQFESDTNVRYFHTAHTPVPASPAGSVGVGFHYLAVRKNGLDITLRYDGVEVGPTTLSGYAGNAETNFKLGHDSESANALSGDIAEFLTYDRALSSGEMDEVEAYLSERYAL